MVQWGGVGRVVAGALACGGHLTPPAWPPSLAQTHCFTTPEGASAVDWLGRQEHFHEDFAALVDILNARPGVPQLPRPEGGVERVNYNASPCEGEAGAGASANGTAAAEGQPGLAARRALRSAWEVREGIFNPCDKMDYFRWDCLRHGLAAPQGSRAPGRHSRAPCCSSARSHGAGGSTRIAMATS